MTSLDLAVRGFPGVSSVLRARYERNFLTPRGVGCLMGEHATFASAARAAGEALPVGYDVPSAGTLYRDRMHTVLLKDYPALFWLAQTMPTTTRLFDIGGHVGLMYYAYRRYLTYHDDLAWTVCDVPAVVSAGEALARERAAHSLRFTSSLDAVDGSEVVLATDSLQYIDRSLADVLGACASLPTHVLVNETPTHEDREIITLQNIGVAICPYRIAHRIRFVNSMTALGYQLIDAWEDPARRTDIPFVTKGGAVAYSGFCFRLP